MTKKRVKRPKGELTRELNQQIELLEHACKSFDSGFEPVGKHISLSLRILLHHHGQTQSLLHQLGLRSKQFMDTAHDLNPNNLLTDCPLTLMLAGTSGSNFAALCQQGGGPLGARWIPFVKWWNNSVIKDNEGRFFSRRELVLNVANTDGGAHVDPTLDKAYLDLSRNNSLGWIIQKGEVQHPFPPPVMACLRQIAHEVLATLKIKGGVSVVVQYSV